MTPGNNYTHRNTRSFETALTELLHTAQTTDGDPEGTYTLPAPTENQPAYTVEITVAATAAERTQQRHHSYCLDCDWTVSTTAYPRAEVTRRMVRHATETGHDIESTERGDATRTDGSASPVSDNISPENNREIT